MTILEMHEQFRMLAQQAGLQMVNAIFEEEIDMLLNQEILNVTRSIFSRKTNRELNGISDNVVRLAELSNLYVNEVVTSTKENILYGVGYKIYTSSFYEELMYLISVSSSTGGVYNKCRLIELDRVLETNNDYHSKSIKESPIAYNYDSSIEILASKFDVDSLIVNYLRYPAKVSLENEVDCDLAKSLHYDCVEKAVNAYNASINNPSYEKVLNETQNK